MAALRTLRNAGTANSGKMVNGSMKTAIQIAAFATGLFLLGGCIFLGEWRPYDLHNPKTGRDAACFSPWGNSLSASVSSLPIKDIIHLRQCINECEANGYVMNHPEELPALPPGTDVPKSKIYIQCEPATP